MAQLEIRRILLPPYDNNCYVVVCSETQESIIVDAPSNPDKILELARGTQLRVVVITPSAPGPLGSPGGALGTD